MTAPGPIPAADLRPRDKLVWTTTDGATIYMSVSRVDWKRGVTYLRCFENGRSWTRRHEGALFPSMKRQSWTTADLLETIR